MNLKEIILKLKAKLAKMDFYNVKAEQYQDITIQNWPEVFLQMSFRKDEDFVLIDITFKEAGIYELPNEEFCAILKEVLGPFNDITKDMYYKLLDSQLQFNDHNAYCIENLKWNYLFIKDIKNYLQKEGNDDLMRELAREDLKFPVDKDKYNIFLDKFTRHQMEVRKFLMDNAYYLLTDTNYFKILNLIYGPYNEDNKRAYIILEMFRSLFLREDTLDEHEVTKSKPYKPYIYCKKVVDNEIIKTKDKLYIYYKKVVDNFGINIEMAVWLTECYNNLANSDYIDKLISKSTKKTVKQIKNKPKIECVNPNFVKH